MTWQKLHSAQDLVNVLARTTQEVAQRTKKFKEEARATLKELLAVADDARTFANTVAPFDALKTAKVYFCERMESLAAVSPDKALREAATKTGQEVEAFSVDEIMIPQVYHAFKALDDTGLKEAGAVRCTREHLDAFEREGFHLSPEAFARAKQLKKEVAQLMSTFDTAIREDASVVRVHPDHLTGVDPTFVAGLDRADDGMVTLRADYPTRSAVLPHCTNPHVRRDYYRMFANRAYPKNKVVFEQLIAKRDELAKALGFASFAHNDLASKMAKDPEKVAAVLNDLVTKAQPKMQERFRAMTADLPEGFSLNEKGQVRKCDTMYLNQQYVKKHFKLDPREVAHYFPVDTTIEGLFSIYQTFLGLEFCEEKVTGLWDDSVRVISVARKGQEKRLGYIMLDLYPREGKYSHACQCSLLPALIDEKGSEAVSASLVIANFPTATHDKPALLTHNDVTTFFHEFGHAMHAVLGYSTVHSFVGTDVKWDFVETPSQMFEEWMWDREMLKKVSSHYQTGAALPDPMIDAMLAQERFNAASWARGQSAYALLAFAYYKEGAVKDATAIMHDLFARVSPEVALSDDDHFYASFGHLSGYAATYYAYVWSKIFAKDLFSEVKKHGLLDEALGKKFVDTVLSRGGSKDPNELMQDFLGREVSNEAFLESMGLLRRPFFVSTGS